jgi:hypothetical protein
MMMMKSARASRFLIGSFGMILLAATFACGGSGTSPSETVTEPPFTGTLKANDASYFGPFTVAKDGSVTMTATSLSPQSDAAIGLGLGQFVGNTCVIQINEPGFYVGQPLAFNGISAGQYCGSIFDIGYLTQDNTFTVSVAHP